MCSDSQQGAVLTNSHLFARICKLVSARQLNHVHSTSQEEYSAMKTFNCLRAPWSGLRRLNKSVQLDLLWGSWTQWLIGFENNNNLSILNITFIFIRLLCIHKRVGERCGDNIHHINVHSFTSLHALTLWPPSSGMHNVNNAFCLAKAFDYYIKTTLW